MTSKVETNEIVKQEPTLTDVIEAMQVGFGRMDDEFEEVHTRLDRAESITEDILKTLRTMSTTIGSHSVSLPDHERRITRLEQAIAY